MKKWIIALLLTLNLFGSVEAQEPVKPTFLFGSAKVLLSGFGGPLAEFCSIDKKFALYKGGGGALLINQTWFIGGYGMELSTSHYREDLRDITGIDRPKLFFEHGGLWLGYIYRYKKPFHAGFSLKLGGGEISLVDEFFQYGPLDDRTAVDRIFVATPQLETELSLAPWIKFNAAIGYRYIAGMDKKYILSGGPEQMYYNRKDFSRPFLSAGFYFGYFNQSR
jgi:hypothetical protein